MAQKGRYTKFSNKIGLYGTSKGSYINNDTDVVLNFPFKDTVLEAGMSKEDVGREERFLHIELDNKDIDTLEEPKVLTNFHYVDKEGDKRLNKDSSVEFFDDEGNLKQNLLIKGNNLLALYTLREKLAGKVKLIYIDPPYYFRENKQADTFLYNSNFKLSGWLTFMKNRLEIAKEMLSDDGVMLISISDDGQAYLRVLMDEVFGQENFVANMIWEKKKKPSFLSNVGGVTEFIIAYAKNRSNAPIFQYGQTTKGKKYPVNNAGNTLNTLVFPAGSIKFNIIDQVIQPQDMSEGKIITKLLDELTIENGKNKNEFRLEGEWRYSQERLNEILRNNEQVVISKIPFRPNHIKDGGEPKRMHNLLSIAHYSMSTYEDATAEGIKLFGAGTFDYMKPEKLLKVLIESVTDTGDLVMDFCLGSGTTAAVAQKLGRKWIGIEQMDYIETFAKERLVKVINGEKGGVSESVDWNGGGSFVYFELKKYNQEYVDRIMNASSLSELEDLYVDMRNNAFLKFWFDRNEFEKDESFRKLDIEQRKQKLIDVLDENQLYLNYADMNDTRHEVSDDEKTLTDKFYGTAEN